MKDRLSHSESSLARRSGQCDTQLRFGLEQSGEHDHDGAGLARTRTTRKKKEVFSHGGSHGQGLVLVDLGSKGLAKEIKGGRVGIDRWTGEPQGKGTGNLPLVLEMPPEVKMTFFAQDEGKSRFFIADWAKGAGIGVDRRNLPGGEVTGSLPRLLCKLAGQLAQGLGAFGRFPSFEKGSNRPA